jgi:NADH dehydrogenase FAD-containing subunit
MYSFSIQVSTRGPRPNTAFVAKSLGEDALDERKQIKVTPTLQLPNHPDIFALGDAINTVEQKQVMKAMAHGGIITGNIIAQLSGKSLSPYKGATLYFLHSERAVCLILPP